MDNPAIVSIGTSVPEHKVSQSAFMDFMSALYPETRENRLKMRKVLHGSGIEFRHSVLSDFAADQIPSLFKKDDSGRRTVPGLKPRMLEYEKHAFPLSLLSVDECFKKISWVTPSDITHLITFSCTGMYAPGIDIQLIEALDIPGDVERYHINFMGCYAAFNALKAAAHICRSEPKAMVLLSGVELCSLHFNNLETDEQIVANSIFSDGASAVLVTAQSNIPISEKCSLELKKFHSGFTTSTRDQMVWNVGERSFDLRLSPYVPDSILGEINGFISGLLKKNGLKMNDVNHFAIHPGGMKILQACEKGLGIPSSVLHNSYDVLRNYGNMSSVTVLFVLNALLESLNESDKGNNVLSCAFGPGLTTESVIAKII